MLLGIRSVVVEDAAAYDAASFCPVVKPIFLEVRWVRDFVVLEAVVVEACVLVAPVPCSRQLGIMGKGGRGGRNRLGHG